MSNPLDPDRSPESGGASSSLGGLRGKSYMCFDDPNREGGVVCSTCKRVPDEGAKLSYCAACRTRAYCSR